MGLQTFFDNLALLADAPNSIPKLHELILQLAVRGKLVVQDPKDEPASLLIQKGLRAKQKQLTSSLDIEIPHEIPTAWQWVRFENIVDFEMGKTPNTKVSAYWADAESGFAWVSIADMPQSGYITRTKKTVSQKAIDEVFKRAPAPKGTLLMSFKLSIGKVAFLDMDAFHNEAIISIYPFVSDIKPYLRHCLRGINLLTDSNKAIKGNTLNSSSLRSLSVPLPPLEEQKRIATKVDELMLLCNDLKARQQVRRESRFRLNNATLAPLNNAASLAGEEFQQAYVRLADNFAALYDSADTIGKLRSTILQLAVQGKLVRQDRNDESASELHKHIQSEQAQQQSEDPYKTSKPLPPIAKSDRSFPLPRGWEWFRLRALVFTLGDGLHGTPEYLEGTECYFINGNNLVDGQIVIKPHTKTVSLAEMQKHKKRMTLNTVLVSINGTLGSVGFYNNENVILGKSACYFNLSSFVDKYFVRTVIESPYFVNYAMANATGTTIRNLGLRAMNYFPVPLPPLAEQRRIVAKVNQLMALCDELEAKLRQADADSERLMNAAVQHVLDAVAGKQRSQRESALAS